HNIFGLALTETITGGLVSTTVTVLPHETWLLALSVTVTPMELVPNGKLAVKVTLAAAGGLLAGMALVCMEAPFTDQTTLRASPSVSDTSTVNSVGTLQAT